MKIMIAAALVLVAIQAFRNELDTLAGDPIDLGTAIGCRGAWSCARIAGHWHISDRSQPRWQRRGRVNHIGHIANAELIA